MKHLNVLDKKRNAVDTDGILELLNSAKRLAEDMDVGQREATITLKPKHPNLPAFFWLLCDSHLGSVLIDYPAFSKQYQQVRNTPNFYAICNGDEIDGFLVGMGGTSAGVYEDTISPEQQALLMRGLFKALDKEGKVAGMSFGNHNQWVKNAGLKFENTWLRDFTCPILNCGGQLTVNYGQQSYKIALTHRYFGGSRLNITNPPNASLTWSTRKLMWLSWATTTPRVSSSLFGGAESASPLSVEPLRLPMSLVHRRESLSTTPVWAASPWPSSPRSTKLSPSFPLTTLWPFTATSYLNPLNVRQWREGIVAHRHLSIGQVHVNLGGGNVVVTQDTS